MDGWNETPFISSIPFSFLKFVTFLSRDNKASWTLDSKSDVEEEEEDDVGGPIINLSNNQSIFI